MSDTTIKKVDANHSPQGKMGQKYLCSGKHLSMRLWKEMPGGDEPQTRREYEMVGFVVKGRAELELEGQTIQLSPGESWLVPEGATHRYRILEPFEAIEATSPPSHVHGRDDP